MTIGIVIPSTPLYSETFFETEINILCSEGIKVHLFVWKKEPNYRTDVNVYQEVQLSKNPLSKAVKVILVLLYAVIFYPTRLRRYWTLMNKQKLNFKTKTRRLISNHHILKTSRLDYLHFGYASMTTDKEDLAKVIGTKMLVSLRGADIGMVPIFNKGIYDKLWPHVNKVHAASQDLLLKAKKVGMPKNLNVKVIYPPLAQHFVSAKRNRFGFKHGQRMNIVTVARLHWKKGINHTLKALSIIHKKGIPFSYVILGEGEERENILFETEDLNLTPFVKMKGKVSNQEVKEILSQSDISINYSLQEGFCIAALEAQAMGNLTFVSDAEGLGENVEDTKSGWVISRRNPDLLANKIIEIYNMPEDKLLEISYYASNRATTLFSHEKFKEQLLNFYNYSI